MKPRKSNATFSDDAALEYIMALENPHKVGWDSKNRVWRTPKDKGYDKNQIAYGLDIRQDHNPVVYNFLKEKGRLKDPWLTEGEATNLMSQLYAAKNSSVNKAVEKMGGNISQRGYNVLRGMAWHGHPMKQLLNPDSITGKAFLRAIANGDRDLNSVFDAYYGYGSNATQFADRIKADARQRGSIIMETLGDGNKRMRFQPVPQWKPQPLPKPIPETQYPLNGSQAPESISSWNGADSPSAVPTIPSIQKLNNKRNADIQGAFSLPEVTVTGNRRTSLLPRIPSLSDVMQAYSPQNQLNRQLAQSLGLDEFQNDIDVTSDLFRFKNGKLPKYEDGVAADATWHEHWLAGRQAQLKENMSLHPRYKYSNAWDAEHQIQRLKNTPEFSGNLPSGNYGLSNGGKIVYDDEQIKKYSGDRIDVYPEGVRVHERSHAMQPLPQEDKISRIGGTDSNKNPYIDKPSEIYSGLMEQRYRLKLSPDYKVTPEDIKQWRDNGLLNIYLQNKSDDVLLQYFNEVASNPNPLFDPNAVQYAFGPFDGKMLYAKNGKLPITTSGAGYIPDADLRSAVKNAAYKYLFGDLPIDTIRKRLYDGVRPVSYHNTIKRIKEAMSGKKYSDDVYYWENRDPIWAEYLQIPENQRHDSNFGKLQQSKFRPTIGDDPSAVYYVYPDMISRKTDDLIKRANGVVFRPDRKGIFRRQLDNNEYLKFGQSKVDNTLSDAFGKHTISRNVDPNRGEYISYYDLWDLAPFKSHGSDESMGIGKPVHFYDRLYLDDFYGVDSSVRGYPKGTYYGGWLPEVTIRPRK